MSEETNIQDNQERDPTPEEIAEMRAKMESFYDKETPFLEKQEKYERLTADIEEHKTRKLVAMSRSAQFYLAQMKAEEEAMEEQNNSKTPPPPPAQGSGAAEPTPQKKRKLKTE